MRSYIVLALIFILVGCSDTARPKKLSKPRTEQSTLNAPSKPSPTPFWVKNPYSDTSKICGLGSSSLNDTNFESAANMGAKADISEQIQLYINTQFEVRTGCKNHECQKKVSSWAQLQSAEMVRNTKHTNRWKDPVQKRYYIQLCTTKPKLNAINIYSQKTSCIQQSSYSDKTLSELKKILINKAKQESLEELYGALIFSATDMHNGKITSTQIKSRAVGAVRVDGNPEFYNGKNLGEICTNVKSYITPSDLEKYSPQEVKLSHFCFNDSGVPIKNVKYEARAAAYKEMIAQYKPSLNAISKKQAENLIHGYKESNAKFDFSTASYCFDATATILPYELEISDGRMGLTDQNKTKFPITGRSCNEIKKLNVHAKSGVYSIKPNKDEYQVYCDMDSSGGGWTLIAHANIENGFELLKSSKPINDDLRESYGVSHAMFEVPMKDEILLVSSANLLSKYNEAQGKSLFKLYASKKRSYMSDYFKTNQMSKWQPVEVITKGYTVGDWERILYNNGLLLVINDYERNGANINKVIGGTKINGQWRNQAGFGYDRPFRKYAPGRHYPGELWFFIK